MTKDKKNVMKLDVKKLGITILTNLPTPEGLTIEGHKALSLMAIAVIAWVFEVIPTSISSLFVILMPVFGIVQLYNKRGVSYLHYHIIKGGVIM